MNRTNKIIKTTSLLALFLALSVLLNFVEHQIPMLVSIPGVKLGIANTMGLIVLYFFGKFEYGLIGFFRVLLAGLLFTGLFSSTFFLSFSGWFLSTIVCIILVSTKKLSIYSLSIASAIFHGIGQTICAAIYYSSIYRAMYGLAILYVFDLNESEKAIPLLEKLLTIDTRNTDAMMVLANAYYQNYEFDKAVELYDKIISISTSPEKKAAAEANKKLVLEMAYGE